jgi:type VI secretion system secreted protein Hcp
MSMSDIYTLTIPGITGNDLFSEEIVAKSIICITWEISANLPMQLDIANAERTSGRVVMSDMKLTKMVDLSTTALYSACAAGSTFEIATLKIGRTAAGVYSPQMEWTMTNAMISSIHTHGQGRGQMPLDTFTISFTGISLSYSQQDNTAAIVGSDFFGWDLATNTAIESQ